MDGGSRTSRDSTETWRSRRHRPVRVGLSACLIAVLAAYLVGSGRQPTHEVLAAAATGPSGGTGGAPPSTAPPVRLPQPTGQQLHHAASVSGPPVQSMSAGAAGIPDVALSAYQRSAVVMDAANPSCRIDWALLAAIGQVESDHGQFGGSHLNRHGVAVPPIYGPLLDGRHGTSRVTDTDAGRLDGNKRFDRAVGPMQFLPSTWAAVAVDGDGDGRRDVQDINDASLGSAVYLCADNEDLATKGGQRHALLRYNHSQAYAAQVLAIAEQLRTSSLFLSSSATPQDVSNLTDLTGLSGPDSGGRHHGHDGHHGHHRDRHHSHGPHLTPGTTSPPSHPKPSDWPSGSPSPTPWPTPSPSPTYPSTPTDSPSPSDPSSPSDSPTEPPVLTDPLPDELSDLTPDQVDAYNAAWAVCDDDLVPGWSGHQAQVDALTQCLAEQLVVATDDPDLVAFVSWLARTEDGQVP